MTPRVAIIILNWNGLRDTLDCLASLQRLDYPSYEVVVVDNGSTDGSAPAILERFPHVTVIRNDENLGFAGGNNVGIRHALECGADCLLLLNNDTDVALTSLSRLVEAAEADPKVGIAGPTIYYYDRPKIIWSAGGAIDWRRGSTRMVGLDEREVGRFGSEPRVVDFVTGCCMLVRRAVVEEVGLLDERFFAYYEEVDWCVRARRAGLEIIHVPQAWIWHKVRPNRQALSRRHVYLMTRNQLLFLRDSGAGLRVILYVMAQSIRTVCAWSVFRRHQDKRPLRSTVLRGVADYLAGRFGEPPVSI